MNKYQDNLRRFVEKKQDEASALSSQLIATLHSLKNEILAQFPQLNRMVVVGSVVGGGFSENSDIDIVVAGIKHNDYFKLLIFLEKKLNRHIDLIVEEDLSDVELLHILAKKEVIYDKSES